MEQWNLKEVFASNDEFLKEVESFKEQTSAFLAYEGKLNNKNTIEEYFSLEEKMDSWLSKLYSYGSMNFDLNQANLEAQGNMSKLQDAYMSYAQAVSFVSDELLKINQNDYIKWAEELPLIKSNLYRIDQLFHSKEHVLKPEIEKILTLYNPITQAFRSTYGLLESSDIKPVELTLSDGKTVKYTKNNYTTLLEEYSNSQEDRKRIFEGFFKHYDDFKNTYAKLYKGVVDADIARMKSRGYSNILDTFLDNNKIDKNVYLTLLKTVRENTAPLKRYMEFRKKYFNLSEYHTYDRFLSISSSDAKYPYQFAKEEVLKALEPMGKDFLDHAKVALADGHVDVFPVDGKRSGAYSTEIEGFGPYILLNHTDSLDSAFTLAHECGHSIHTLYSTENQPYATKNYVIFVAEIASTFNENLFLDYLLSKSDDKAVKIQALEKQINNIVSTFYRQALFADFEYQAHEKAINGAPLTYKELCDIMADLYKTYYGIDLDTEPLKKYVWAYIPHIFNSPFYVYQYATCFSASQQIFADVKAGKPNAKEKYLEMLKAGGSDYPVEIVKKGGVDLTTEKPFKAVCDNLDHLLDELEKLVK